MGLLDGKRALITGSRKGIGRGIALTMAREGADVGINDIIEDSITRQAADVCRAQGVKATVHQGDVSSVDGVNAVIDSFVNSHGGIDILINNAIFPDQSRPFFQTDEAYWDRMMDLSLKGYFFASQKAAKHMVAQGTGGRIVCMSSVHSYAAWKDWTAYGIAKMGLRRMVKGIAVDLTGTGITANCIAPGAIVNVLPEDSAAIDGRPYKLEDMPSLKSRVPAQRGGLPSDIANAVLYLTSSLGEYVNGETILVDGGMMASAGPQL
jgi:NAD(P)-dependent dehydrogenase (short-subunit alcohol dehydrogenase family)